MTKNPITATHWAIYSTLIDNIVGATTDPHSTSDFHDSDVRTLLDEPNREVIVKNLGIYSSAQTSYSAIRRSTDS